MFNRRHVCQAVAIAMLSFGATGLVLPPRQAAAQAATPPAGAAGPSANARLSALGPEALALATRAGTWDATLTSFSRSGGAPAVLTGLVAERQMIGPMLQEILRSVPGAPGPRFERVDDLTFNRLEGRWDYMSMDSGVPDGLMVAWSLDHDAGERIFVSFLPFATAGDGPEATGRMFRMEQVITRLDADHETKDQFFTPADGTGTKFLAKRYSYTRRPQP